LGIEIKKVCVIGAGLMGHGIAQVLAMNGYGVNLVDVSEDILNKALEKIRWSLGKLAEKGALKEDIAAVMGRIKTTVKLLDAVKDVDFVIEAVPERLDLKCEIFAEIDGVAPKHCIFASNTSGLPITLMAEATKRPEKVIGMHWFNPPQLMRLIEVVKTKYTSNETTRTVFELSKKLGKTPILVKRDINGFIANRVYRAISTEAFLMYLRGEAQPMEIDATFRYKLRLPMGPFELTDFTGGIDIAVSSRACVEDILRRFPEWEPHRKFLEFSDATYSFIKERYDRGLLGVKTGQGFYKYPGPGKWAKPHIPEKYAERIDPLEVVAVAINVSAWLIRNDVASAQDIDVALKLGYNFPMGLLEYADERGLDAVVEILEAKLDRVKEPYAAIYEPDELLSMMVKEGKLGRRAGQGFYRY